MNGNLHGLLAAIGGLVVVVVLLNSIRPYLRKRKHQRAMAKIDQDYQNEKMQSDDEMLVEESAVLIDPLPADSQTEFSIDGASEISLASTKKEPVISSVQAPREKKKHTSMTKDDLIMISIHARPGQNFGDYNFLQTLGAAGLCYGDHKIFHYDVKTDIGEQRLFSVAKLNNPGTFDIDNIESLDCKGLLMFVNLKASKKITLAVDCLLEVAYQLSDDLDGIMCEGYNTPWREDTAERLQERADSCREAKLQKSCMEAGCEVVY